MRTRGKKYEKVMESFDKDKIYSISEALDMLPKLSTSKFVGSAEAHFRLGVDPKASDQNIRGTVSLPGGTGKKVRVVVIAEGNPSDFVKAGAIKAGAENIIAEIEGGFMDFDVIVAEANMMPKMAKLAKVLGPKGLMPSPKAGTVGPDAMKALKEVMAGRVEVRVDAYGIAHVAFGKLDFEKSKLEANLKAIIDTVKALKPSSVKSKYLLSVTLAPTMGPGVKVEVNE